MENKSFIIEIFSEDGPYAERVCPKNREYREICRVQNQKEEHLKKLLNEEQLDALNELLDAKFEVVNMEIDETFRVGVSFGIKITSEAFLLDA